MARKFIIPDVGVKLIFLAAITLLLSLAVVTFIKTKKLIDLADTVNHTNRVKVEIEKALSYLKDAETGQRGYLLTNDPIFLEPFNNALSNTHNSLRRLDSLLRGNQLQMINMRMLHHFVDSRIDYLGKLVQQAQSGGKYTAQQLLQGKFLMDNARTHVEKMVKVEDAVLAQRQAFLNEEAAITPVVAILLTLFALFILVAAYFKIIWELDKSRKLQLELVEKEVRLQNALDELELNKAQQVSQETARRFELIANTMTQFTWTADREGKFNYLNRSFSERTGLDTGNITKYGWVELVHPDDRESSMKRWRESIESGKPYTQEHRFRIREGTYRWQLSRAVPLTDNDGKVMLWVGTSTDIQAQKDFAQSLEQQVQLRTSELVRANHTLEKANEELAQFAYVASHDLQEPLRKIQTFISMLEDSGESLSEKGRQYFDRIQNAAKRMQQLIVDILSYSRATNVDAEFEEKNLNDILNAAKDQLSELIQHTHAEISAENLPVLKVISFQFEQLLGNILSNAIKFTKPGEHPVIHITAGKRKREEIDHPAAVKPEYHYISIQDKGIGFERQYKDRIFSLFQRLNSRDLYGGTGIGLAIVKKIVENHNGFITADSELGNGATFTIYIPVA